MAAARTQTIVVAQPNQRRSGFFPRRRRSSGKRRSNKRGGTSPAKQRDRQNTKTLTLGGVTALAFGLIQRNVKLPGIPGVPNSLTYGAGLAAVGIVAKSDPLLKMSCGPLFAGLHNIGLRGIGADNVAGEDDETAGLFDEGDQTAGLFDQEEVTAGDFEDL